MPNVMGLTRIRREMQSPEIGNFGNQDFYTSLLHNNGIKSSEGNLLSER